MSLFLTLVKKTAFKYFAKMVEVPRNIFIKNNDISLKWVFFKFGVEE
jgi:hypothetical protein